MELRRERARRAAVVALIVSAACTQASQAPPKLGDGRKWPDVAPPVARGSATGSATTASVGTAGGSFATPDGGISVRVPAGAVSATTQFTMQPITRTAPGTGGAAWRLGPEGTTFPVPVRLTFRIAAGTSLDDASVAYQDAQGYWLRVVDAQKDAVAHAITVPSTHFSDWTYTTTSTAHDLSGAFTIASTMDPTMDPTLTGSAVLTLAGSDATSRAYLLSGTVALPSPVTSGTATCDPTAPETTTLALRTNIADVSDSPPLFWWGMSGHWNLTCSDGSTPFLALAFDSNGLDHPTCAGAYVGTPVIGPDRLQGQYVVNCGASGTMTASWDFRGVSCGGACVPATACHAGSLACDTGVATCTDTGTFLADGTSCGTFLTCSGGSCVCTQGAACTPAQCYTVGSVDCTTTPATCASSVPAASGTSCTRADGSTGSCDGSGACL